MKITAIIAAAGASRRMGGGLPKQYRMCDGLPVLIRTCKTYCDASKVDHIDIAVPAGDEGYVLSLIEAYGITKVAYVVSGGAERRDTVAAALSMVPPDTTHVLVQDGARPFVTEALIDRVIGALADCDAAIPGVTPKNTIRTAEQTLDRSLLYEVQTPQGFELGLLTAAYQHAYDIGFVGTDDAGIVEKYLEGLPFPLPGAPKTMGIRIVEGDYANIKITTPEDLPMNIRTGMGYDVHKLVGGRKLMLGCTEIPYEQGLLGHSDADVLSHAIADALLGAAALGDIGRHFPDHDPACEGMPGAVLLEKTKELLAGAGFSIVNIDATLVAQKPKIAPYAAEMIRNTSAALGIPESACSIKATTEEGLGITGDGSAMTAYAVATIR